MAKKRPSQDDDVVGGDFNDLLNGLAGNDTLTGNGGDDRLDGGKDDDVLTGGAGNDTLVGGTGTEEYRHSGTAADGDDVIETGDDIRDRIVFTTPDLFDFDFLREGNDLIVGILNPETEESDGTLRIKNHYAGAAIAYIQADFADLNLDYGINEDLATIYFTPNLKKGLDNLDVAEILIGTTGNDVINGNAGYFDFLTGGDGNDLVHGGDGFDNVRGGAGDDKLFGDAGNDVMRGDLGDDFIDGGTGVDLVRYDGSAVTSGILVDLSLGFAKDLEGDDVNSGTDSLGNIENVRGSMFGDKLIGNSLANFVTSGAGDDEVHGAGGNDTLFGEANNDALFGGDGNDQLDGGAGNDGLHGDSGNNTLTGGAGNDQLYGDIGNDVFNGGAGDDFILSSAGLDLIFFDALGSGTDLVQDFDRISDSLFLTGVGDQNGDENLDILDLLVLTDGGVSDDGSSVTVSFSSGATLVFGGVGTGDINDIRQLVQDESQIIVA
jgi:Ca2+-binding RTX toxin-like protein